MRENLRDVLLSVDSGPGLQRTLLYSEFLKQIHRVKLGLNKLSLPHIRLSNILFNHSSIFAIDVMVI